MRRKAVRKHKPPPTKAKPLQKDLPGDGGFPAGRAGGSGAVGDQQAGVQAGVEPPPAAFVAVAKEASLMEQLFANDSLGG